jgi:hypothetical protein
MTQRLRHLLARGQHRHAYSGWATARRTTCPRRHVPLSPRVAAPSRDTCSSTVKLVAWVRNTNERGHTDDRPGGCVGNPDGTLASVDRFSGKRKAALRGCYGGLDRRLSTPARASRVMVLRTIAPTWCYWHSMSAVPVASEDFVTEVAESRHLS